MKFPEYWILKDGVNKGLHVFTKGDIEVWRDEQKVKNREQEDFIEKTVKPNLHRAKADDILKEYEEYVKQVKESLS